jgi:hypothetical protein
MVDRMSIENHPLRKIAEMCALAVLLLPALGVFMIVGGGLAPSVLLLCSGMIVGNLGIFNWWLVRHSLRFGHQPLTRTIAISNITRIRQHNSVFWLLRLCGLYVYAYHVDDDNRDGIALSVADDLPRKGDFYLAYLYPPLIYWIE